MASASISDAPPVAVAVAVPVEGATPIDKSKPPGRVRAMFKRLDKDANGTLTAEELKAGFEKEFGGLTDAAKEFIPKAFEDMAVKDEKTGERGLTTGNFSQFYSLVLFKNFDKSNTSTLNPEEAAAALNFLRKPVDGKVPEVAVATPVGADGGMTYNWFWRELPWGSNHRPADGLTRYSRVRDPCRNRAIPEHGLSCVDEIGHRGAGIRGGWSPHERGIVWLWASCGHAAKIL